MTSSHSSSTTRLISAARAPTTSRTDSAIRADVVVELVVCGPGRATVRWARSPAAVSPTPILVLVRRFPPVAVVSRLGEGQPGRRDFAWRNHRTVTNVATTDVRRRISRHRRPSCEQRERRRSGLRTTATTAPGQPACLTLEVVARRAARADDRDLRGAVRPRPARRPATSRRTAVPDAPARRRPASASSAASRQRPSPVSAWAASRAWIVAEVPDGLALSPGSRGRATRRSPSRGVSWKPPSSARKWVERGVEQVGAASEPALVAGGAAQREEAARHGAVVLQHAGRASRPGRHGTPAAAGRRRGGRRPAGAPAASAASTYSSSAEQATGVDTGRRSPGRSTPRPPCRRAPAAPAARARRAGGGVRRRSGPGRPGRGAAAASRCRARTCRSPRSSSVAHAPSSSPRTSAQLLAASRRRSGPPRPRCRRRAPTRGRPRACRSSRSRKSAVTGGDAVTQWRAPARVEADAAGRCRRASSRSAAPPTPASTL